MSPYYLKWNDYIMTVQISKLPNGLRIATDSMEGAESVAIGVWVGVGTRHEPWRAGGIAHLTEHMLFKGTKNRSAFALSSAIEKKGGSLNAHTTREETAYYARVMPEDTGLAMDILADMIQHSAFAPKELDRERQVIIQEIGRDKDTPDEFIGDLTHEVAFPKQKMGRSILGTPQTIGHLPRQHIADYVKKHYHANNIIIVATGKIEHEQIATLAQTHFGKLPAGKPTKTEKAKIKGGDLRQARDIEQLHLMLSFPAPSYKSTKAHAAALLGVLLGGSSSSRLFQKIREKRGLVYTISSWHLPFQDTGLFSIYAGTDPARAQELIPVLCHELHDVRTRITPSELRRAKAQVRTDILMNRESVMHRAETLGSYMLAHGRAPNIDKMLKKIMAATEEDVRAAATTLFSKKPIFTALGPTKNLEPYQTLADRIKA